MPESQIIGYAVLAIITLGSFVAVIDRFTQPITELKIVIQELKDCIATLKNDNALQNKRIEKHGEEIDELKRNVSRLETRMDMYHHNTKAGD